MKRGTVTATEGGMDGTDTGTADAGRDCGGGCQICFFEKKGKMLKSVVVVRNCWSVVRGKLVRKTHGDQDREGSGSREDLGRGSLGLVVGKGANLRGFRENREAKGQRGRKPPTLLDFGVRPADSRAATKERFLPG